MRIEIIKEHVAYELGQHEVTEERGKYLIAMGVAAEIDGISEPPREKRKYKPRKEKQEYHNTPVKVKRTYKVKS